MAADTVTSIVNIVGQINPLIGVATQILSTVRSITAAARAANVTVLVNPATGVIYATKADAVADGVDPETSVSELPDDSVLIARFLRESGMLKSDAADARKWLRDSALLS